MKLQNLTVIFIIIIIPIILLVSLYISTGLKTIKYQAIYDEGLLTATHDAIYAFEINTINNEYSDNAETKRNILKSSIKAFEKSLCNTCAIPSYNTDEIEEYIPAVVFGMYDGFYMYAPSYNSKTGKYEHGLKNYVYYSETLSDGTVIRYSLDNYVSVTLKKDNGDYEVKEGYLINPDDINIKDGKVKYKGVEINSETIDGFNNTDAIDYYKEAQIFTNWFINNNINEKANYLNITDDNDPEDESSAFSKNKRKIIKETIESVLNSSITAYSERTWGQNYKMPKLSDDDWEKIYSNISMITFFQGKRIGLTKYNGYCVLNSTNSNEYVNPNLIYFTDSAGYYHDIRCTAKAEGTLTGYKIGSFNKQKTELTDENGNVLTDKDGNIAYQKLYNHNELACYECINGSLSTTESIYTYTDNLSNTDSKESNIKRAYYTALARERYNQTKLSMSKLKLKDDLTIQVMWKEEPEKIPCDYVEYDLYKGEGEFVTTIEISAEDNWKKTIKGLKIYNENSEKINYYLEGFEKEDTGIYGYEGILKKTDNNWTITYESIYITKGLRVEFIDNSNEYGTRPDETDFMIFLYKRVNGVESYADETWIYYADDSSYITWTSLYRKLDGNEVEYFIIARDIPNYVKTIVEQNNEFILTYTLKPKTEWDTVIKVVWEDYDNIYNTRPEKVTVELTCTDDVSTENYTIELNKEYGFLYNIPGKIEYIRLVSNPGNYTIHYSEDKRIITCTLKSWVQEGTKVYRTSDGTILNVGDYINYKCNTGKTYISKSDKNGYTDQSFSVQENIKWQVLGAQESKLIITSAELQQNLGLHGNTGYGNGINELKNISEIYKDEVYAVESRNINKEDIERIINLNNIASIEGNREYEMIFEKNESYWLSTTKNIDEDYYDRRSFAVVDGRTVYFRTLYAYDYFDDGYGNSYNNTEIHRIRPVIYLKSNIILEKQSDGSYNIK